MVEKRKLIAWFICIPFIGIFAILAFSIILGRHTKYCPYSHWLRNTSSCFVLDERENKVLIQHADFDTDANNYMEIRGGSKSTLFTFPESITEYAPEGYKAVLITGEENTILFNEKRYELKPFIKENNTNQNAAETEN